jgi:hypothetical protein
MPAKSSPSTVEKRAYTVGEFGRAYGVCRSMVYILMRTSRLEYRVYGSRRLIPVEAAERWFAGLPTRTAA